MTEYYDDSAATGSTRPRRVCARAELTNAQIGSDWTDIAFSEAGDEKILNAAKTVFQAGEFVSLDVAAKASTQDASFRVRGRNSPNGSFRTLGSEISVTADEADATQIFAGNLRVGEFKLQQKYTSIDGGAAEVEIALK